jgi:hypothetical protein
MRTPEQIIGKDALLQLTFEGYAVVPVEPTDDMLNAAQSRLCELSSVTNFDDRQQAELFKSMCAVVNTDQPAI